MAYTCSTCDHVFSYGFGRAHVKTVVLTFWSILPPAHVLSKSCPHHRIMRTTLSVSEVHVILIHSLGLTFIHLPDPAVCLSARALFRPCSLSSVAGSKPHSSWWCGHLVSPLYPMYKRRKSVTKRVLICFDDKLVLVCPTANCLQLTSQLILGWRDNLFPCKNSESTFIRLMDRCFHLC